jgi:hypothetical protein
MYLLIYIYSPILYVKLYKIRYLKIKKNFFNKMHTRKILSIVALSLLGLCLLCALAKNAMKGDKSKKACDNACSMSVFAALTLLAVSQLMGEKENFDTHKYICYGRAPSGVCQTMGHGSSKAAACESATAFGACRSPGWVCNAVPAKGAGPKDCPK